MTDGTRAQNFIMIHRAGRNRRPGRRAGLMASGAAICSVDVITGFAREKRIVMAAYAITNHVSVIDIGYGHGQPGIGAVVAGFATVAGIHVAGVFAGGV